LHYSYEIRPVESLAHVKKEIGTFDKQELALANQLVAQFTHKTFDLSAYRDTFSQKLVAEIKKSKSRKKLPEKTVTQKTKKIKESDLASTLKASLQKPGKAIVKKRATKKAE
jgi:non-homologous end joining protein Ku